MSDSAKSDHPPPNKGLQLIRGFPLAVVFKKEVIEEILDYIPHDGDVIIATYPKTGTTWTQYIVHQILTRGKSFPNISDMMEKVVPFMEMSGVAAVDALTTKPRVYKHHFPYNIIHKNPKAKFIYVYRRPDDTFVSYYHFMKHFFKWLDFDQFFEDFLSGDINYASYFDHVLSYYNHKDEGNILMVSYEMLQVHNKEEILRIARFLGEEHYNDILNDESILDNIIRNTSFGNMKKNLTMDFPKDFGQANESKDAPKEKVDLFRKGVVGEGKKSLKEGQLKRLRERIVETMQGTEILKEWLKD